MSEDADILNMFCRNPNMSEEIMLEMAERNEWEVLRSLAKNPAVPPSVLEKMYNLNADTVQCELADNPNLPEHIMAKIVASKSISPRIFLVRNPNLSRKHFLDLCEDKNMSVRDACMDSDRIWDQPQAFARIIYLAQPPSRGKLKERFGMGVDAIPEMSVKDVEKIMIECRANIARSDETTKATILSFFGNDDT